jgi:VanZ like family
MAIMNMKKRWLLTWGPVVGYCLLIFALSAQTTLTAPDGSDKVAHVVEYSVLGLLWARATRATWTTWTWQAVLISTIFFAGMYGASDEWHQFYVPGRFSEIADALADLCGGTVGGISYLSWLWLTGKSERSDLSARRGLADS